MKKLLCSFLLVSTVLSGEPSHDTAKSKRAIAPATTPAPVMETEACPAIRTKGDDVWVSSKQGECVFVKEFRFSDGEPRDIKGEIIDIDQKTRKELAAYFERVLETKTGSEKLNKRAQLFLTAYRHGLEEGKLGHASGGITGHCAQCHFPGAEIPELPPFIDRLKYWEALLTSAEPEAKALAQTWVDKMHRQVVDQKSMPRTDAASLEAFRSSEEGKHLIEFLKKHARPEAPEGAPVKQLLSAQTLARYRAMIPKVESDELSKILSSPGTFFYDEHLFPQSYIDDKPQVTGMLPTDGDIARDRTQIIAGGKFRFPFGQTAGTHLTGGNAGVFNFLHLPTVNGKRLPVSLHKNGDRWWWVFPEGTTIGEVLYQKGKGDLPYEIRVSRKENGDWRYDAFRPFPTSAHLVKALGDAQKTPAFEKNGYIEPLLKHLANPATLVPDSFTPEEKAGFGGFIKQVKAGKDLLPQIDRPLASHLLKTTPFKSSLGAVWREDTSRGLTSYAPTSGIAAHVVPYQYRAHLFPVESGSCNQCHSQTQRTFWTFFSRRYYEAISEVPDLAEYGKLWGSDRKFSFLPISKVGIRAPHPITGNGALQAAGIVENYNAKTHTPELYRNTNVAFPEPP